METGQCIVDRSVKLDAVDNSSLDGRGADLDNIDVERILERACYSARRRRPLYQAPEFTKRLKALENARTGEKVHFECHWTAFPRPAVKWYHDDEEISTDDDRFEIESLRRGVLKLTLKSVTKADEGSYKCKAENQEGVTSTTGYLSVTGDSRKSRSRESRRKRQRAVSLPPHLRTITEQSSLEEREEVACSRQPRSPIQDFIDNIDSFRKDHTWPLLSRHHGADDKRMSTMQKWDDHANSCNETAFDAGAIGGKPSFERVLDNCENPFAKRPLLPYNDDRVTSEGDLMPNGRGVSQPSPPISMRFATGVGRNASDSCGRLPGRVIFPQSKKYKPVVVADVTAALKVDAGEQTPLFISREPAVPPKKAFSRKKAESGQSVDGKQRGRVSPVRARQTGEGKKPNAVRPAPTKDVYARVSGFLCEEKSGNSSKVSVAGLADVIADCGWQGQVSLTGQPPGASDSTAPRSVADSIESSVRPKPESNESYVHPKPDSSESSVHPKLDSSKSSVRPKLDSGGSSVRPKPDSSESSVHPKLDSSKSSVRPKFASGRSSVRPKPDSSELPVHPPVDSDESSPRQKPVSIVSPVGQPVDSKCPPGCSSPASCKTVRAVPAPITAAVTATSASAADDVDVKASARTCTAVAPTTTAPKADPERPVWLYFFLFVTCCAYVGCSLQSYPVNFIFVVTALSMISFRLLLRRSDFLGKS